MELRTVPVLRRCCDADCASAVAEAKFDESLIRQRADAFSALGDPIRLKMVRLLAQHDSLCVCEIQAAFEVGQPTVSHHLKVLRDADLVDVQRKGTWAYYILRRDSVKELVQELLAEI